MHAGEEAPLDEGSKAQLMCTINQFLLQNGLPVTAAALRKEYEKIVWRRKGGTAIKVNSTGLGELLGALTDSEREEHEDYDGEDEPSELWSATMPASKQPAKSAPSSDRRPTNANSTAQFSPRSANKMPRRAQQQSRQSRQSRQTAQQKQNTTRMTEFHSARSRSHQQRHRSSSRSAGLHLTATDTEGESAAEEQRMKKAESVSCLQSGSSPSNAAPPPDPMHRVEQQLAAAPLQMGPLISEWLCAHLDFAAVAQTLGGRTAGGVNRETALLVQALRQLLTRAGSIAGGEANLRVLAQKDVLQLRNRKQSLLSLLLTPMAIYTSHVSSSSLDFSTPSNSPPPHAMAELKDQLTRLLNAIASFRRGRDYLLTAGGGRQLVYESALALRTRRVGAHASDQLLATLQKLSIRSSVQKELVLNGMLEWLTQHLAQPRTSLSALEFGSALLHNLCVCPLAHQSVLRHKDTLLGTLYTLISGARSTQVLHHACATLFTLLSLPRVRVAALERGDFGRILHERMQRTGGGGEQQRQLAALAHILRGELDLDERKQHVLVNVEEDEKEAFPDYLEAEIDSTDALVPSLTELFGQALLIRRFLAADAGPPPSRRHQRDNHVVQFAIEDDQESIPGVVPVLRRTRPSPSLKSIPSAISRLSAAPARKQQQRSTIGSRQTANGSAPSRGKQQLLPDNSENSNAIPMRVPVVHFERSNSMSSHSTFVVENNGRRPLLATNGFANVVVQTKGKPPMLARKRAGEEAAKLESSSSETLVLVDEVASKETANNGTNQSVAKLAQRQNNAVVNRTTGTGRKGANTFNSKLRVQREKWPRRERSEDRGVEMLAQGATVIELNNGANEELGEEQMHQERQRSFDDYVEVFAARPKVVRTPPNFTSELE